MWFHFKKGCGGSRQAGCKYGYGTYHNDMPLLACHDTAKCYSKVLDVIVELL